MHIIHLLSTFFLLYGWGFDKLPDNPIALKLELQKKYVVNLHKDDYIIGGRNDHFEVNGDSVTQKMFDVQLTIRNTSEKPVFIWLMSCSWEDNFLINNSYIYIKGHACDKNVPEIVELKPNESKSYTTTLIKSIKFDYAPEHTVYGKQVETTKMGLIIVNDVNKEDLKSFLNYRLLMDDKSTWKIIWSNPLFLLGDQPKSGRIDVMRN